MIKRTANPSYISHNKFIILLRDNRPIEVLTGSTNFTTGGIFGQSNVGHIVRDPAVAQAYLDYWERLEEDPTARRLRPMNLAATPDPEGRPDTYTITPIFSPRPSLDVLNWYADRMSRARHTVCFTAAFGVNPVLARVLAEDRDHLRYVLLERPGNTYDMISRDWDNRITVGSFIRDDTLYRWLRERLTGFNRHVRYIHTKYMLIDPLSDDPTVITGSANFSDASTRKNDENMLIIRGNTRVADIYLGEFMRLFNHFYFRYHASRIRRRRLTASQRTRSFLHEDDSWTDRYFRPESVKMKQRLLFA